MFLQGKSVWLQRTLPELKNTANMLAVLCNMKMWALLCRIYRRPSSYWLQAENEAFIQQIRVLCLMNWQLITVPVKGVELYRISQSHHPWQWNCCFSVRLAINGTVGISVFILHTNSGARNIWMQWLDVSKILKKILSALLELEFILQYLDYWNGEVLNL